MYFNFTTKTDFDSLQLTINFAEAMQVYMILYIAILYFRFDRMIEELKFEYVRDNVYKDS